MKFSYLFEGINVLQKYTNDESDDDCSAGHDEVYFPGPSPEYMDEKDALYLDSLGFLYDESLDSWHVFT